MTERYLPQIPPGEVISRSELRLPSKVKLEIYFSRHGTAEDAPRLPEKIRNCDVFIPEGVGWHPEYLEMLQAVSDGKIGVDEVDLFVGDAEGNPYEHFRYMLESLHGQKKRVAFVDWDYSQMGKYGESEFDGYMIHPDFDTTIANIRNTLSTTAKEHVAREAHIVSQLPPVLSEVIAADSELNKKPKINVLMTLGSYHTSVFDVMAKEPENAGRVAKVDEGDDAFADYVVECKKMFARGEKVPDELIEKAHAQALIQILFNSKIQEKIKKNQKRAEVECALVDLLSRQEIRDLNSHITKAGLSDELVQRITSSLDAMLV